MIKETFILNNKSGFHARPAAIFVAEASKHKSSITLINQASKEGNAKSILAVIGLGIEGQSAFSLCVQGEDEGPAFHALKKIIETKLVE